MTSKVMIGKCFWLKKDTIKHAANSDVEKVGFDFVRAGC